VGGLLLSCPGLLVEVHAITVVDSMMTSSAGGSAGGSEELATCEPGPGAPSEASVPVVAARGCDAWETGRSVLLAGGM